MNDPDFIPWLLAAPTPSAHAASILDAAGSAY